MCSVSWSVCAAVYDVTVMALTCYKKRNSGGGRRYGWLMLRRCELSDAALLQLLTLLWREGVRTDDEDTRVVVWRKRADGACGACEEHHSGQCVMLRLTVSEQQLL